MIRRLSALLVSALIVAVVAASPASASTTGEVVFNCSMQLPAWPSPNANARCDGTSIVSVSGLDDSGTPYTLAGPGEFHMFIDYATACIAGEPPLLWNAVGQIQVGRILAVRAGAVTQATLSAAVEIVGTPGSFTFRTQGHHVVFADGATASGMTGTGEASMAYVPGASNVCPVGGPLSASVQGKWHLTI